MSRTKNHRKGDTFNIKKNHAHSKRIPRKEWKEGNLFLKKMNKIEKYGEIHEETN